MATYSNTAREVEMPNGDVVVIHNAPTGGENTTSNIKKFKYDDNGHVTESEAANATDLNLNSYSTPTTGSTAIGTSDAVQTAIGKLDHQSHIDQTNILYTIGKVGKNLLNFADAEIHNTRTTYVKSDSDLVATSISNWAYVWFPIGSLSGNVSLSFKISNLINSDATPSVRISKNQDGSEEALRVSFAANGTYNGNLNADGSNYYLIVYLNPSNDAKTISLTFSECMVCDKALYDADPSFEIYGRPNYDLTVREAEDRAALVDAVDKGAKNLLDWKNTTYYLYPGANPNTTYTKTDTSVTITSTGTYAYAAFNMPELQPGNYVLSCKISNPTIASDIIAIGVQLVPFVGIKYSGNSILALEFTVSLATVSKILLYVNHSADNISNTVTFSDIMICSKADWEVSTNYSSYALPNYDLTRLEAEDRAALAEEIDAGAKNKFNISGSSFDSFSNQFSVTYSGSSATIKQTGSGTGLRLPGFVTYLDKGTYVLSGCPSGGGQTTYRLDLRTYNGSAGNVINGSVDEGSGSDAFVITTAGNYLITLRLADGYTVPSAGITVTPMICTKAAFGVSQKFVPFGNDPFYQVPINHNMIYRGRNLGATLTDAQHTALSSGNFTDLYLGDYWTKSVTIPAFYEVTTAEPADWSTNYTSYYTKSGDTYTAVSGSSAPTWAANTYYERQVPEQTVTLKAVIADFDTFYAGYASTYAGINTHHAAVIVHGFNNVVWNKTNSTAGGYVNSLIHKWLVNSVLPQIETWFGSAKVLSHQKLFTNAITGDAASGWAWSSQKIALLSENQMYGSKVWGNSKAANGGYEPGEAFKHLNVFNHIDANLLFGNKNIWLRDIASAEWAASLYISGSAYNAGASYTWIAPAALILLS